MMSHTTWTTLQFVKDKSNLLTFNQWSCGKYLNSSLGFIKGSAGTEFTITPLFFKITNNLDMNNYATVRIELNSKQEYINKNLTISSEVCTKKYPINLSLRFDNVWITSVTTNLINKFNKLQLSSIITSDFQSIIILWGCANQEEIVEFYLDNINVIIQ